MKFLNLPTLSLLNSSTRVAFSGALRLHIAFLFASIEPEIPVYLAMGLIIYSTYTLDRALDSEEDAINRSELTGANRRIAIIASIIAFIAGALIFFLKLFINSVLYDFKDIKGDTAAGIKTLPVYLGKGKVRKILLVLYLVPHCFMAIAFRTGSIRYEPVILLYSFIAGFIIIYFDLSTFGEYVRHKKIFKRDHNRC